MQICYNWIFKIETIYDIYVRYVDIKNGLNLKNPITSKSVDPYTKLCKLVTPVGNFRSM